MTMTMTSSNTMTMGSQSDSDDTTDSGLTMTSAETMTDPTTLDGTDTTASETIGETTTDDPTTTLSAGTTESTDTGVCAEPDEPNQTDATPLVLAEIACETSATVDGVADGSTTPDWFQFHGAYNADVCGAATTDDALPRVLVTAGGPLPVCAYVTCAGTVTCTTGMASVSPSGHNGCCADSDAQLSVNCPGGSDESTDVLVSVDTALSACVEYTLQLSF
jgi:hypothetical protein